MACNHCHEHEHHHEPEHGGEERSTLSLILLAISAVLLAVALIWLDDTPQLIACIISYLLAGWSVLKEAAENILHGEIFDENFLMAVASIGAFCIGEYPEAAAVMLLYQIGELLQDKAVDSSRDSIKALVNIRPDSANLVTEDGVKVVEAKDIPVGAQIVVRPGERIPLDGIICAGSAAVDTSPLTGESLPRQWTAGDTALAGCVDLDGVLTVEVTRPFTESSVSRIMAMVENAQENKAQPEQFITRFAKIYTPVVCAVALLVAILPPLLGFGTWTQFLHKALAFLVISCPCALVISVPLSFFSGIGCASHNGILIKGSNYLEQLAKAEIAAFDKTGTLTEGKFTVTDIIAANGVSPEQLLEIAAYCESQSTHPLAKAIVERYGSSIDSARIGEIHEISGHGIKATIDGKTALAGKPELLSGLAVPADSGETSVYVTYGGQYLGCLCLSDTVKSDTAEAICSLRELGLHDLTMLSGDRQSTADRVAEQVGLDAARGQLLPENKVTALEELKERGTVLYAGDGINDAPVLATADIGIAMGGLGSDAAMEAADIVIMSDEPSKIAMGIKIARKTMRIAKENIVFSIAVKVLILTLSLVTTVGLWLAVFADVGVCMIAVLNSLRAMRA